MKKKLEILKSSKYHEYYELYKSRVKEFYDCSAPAHRLEMAFEACRDWSLFHDLDDVIDWYDGLVSLNSMEVSKIGLDECVGWQRESSSGNIFHESNDFFVVHGVRVKSTDREVTAGWDQPVLTQVGLDGGILGLLRKRFRGVPHYLCEAKVEPGNYNGIQISPTLQATFANLDQAHKGRRPHFFDFFIGERYATRCSVLFDQWLSEDGGRLFMKRNKGVLVDVEEELEIDVPNSSFIWLSLFQIKQLLLRDACVNPHIRGILAHV